ncbi:MAG: site-specific DNA-methyltransferase [Pseudodesulfovibrio sp.]
MATGITNVTYLESESTSSSSFESIEPDLPNEKSKVVLSYPNKATKKEILKPLLDSLVIPHDNKMQDVHNSILWADNYVGLKSLMNSYAGKVELIYLDPPFQTGFNFHSRELGHAYEDKMSPAAYLEFMRRRLILMRELLTESGSLYLHIGHQMVASLKVVLDEVFGKNGFRNIIVRKKCSSKNHTRKQYPNLHDYILFYTKGAKYTWNRPGIKPSQEWIDKEYNKIEKDSRRYKLVPIHAPGVRNGETGREWKGMMPPPGKHWQLKPSKLDKLDEKGEIHWSRTGNPRRKVYLAADKELPRTDYWPEFRDAHHQSILITGYPTEKNLQLLETIVGASSNEGDLILDPFMGSGTTLHAANNLNRNWIGIDESSEAIKTAFQRFSYGLKPMGDYIGKKKIEQALLLDEDSKIKFNVFYDKRYLEEHNNVFNEVMMGLSSR